MKEQGWGVGDDKEGREDIGLGQIEGREEGTAWAGGTARVRRAEEAGS